MRIYTYLLSHVSSPKHLGCENWPLSQVLGLLATEDRSGNTTLMSSIDGGDMQIITACLGAIAQKLRGMKVWCAKITCVDANIDKNNVRPELEQNSCP